MILERAYSRSCIQLEVWHWNIENQRNNYVTSVNVLFHQNITLSVALYDFDYSHSKYFNKMSKLFSFSNHNFLELIDALNHQFDVFRKFL